MKNRQFWNRGPRNKNQKATDIFVLCTCFNKFADNFFAHSSVGEVAKLTFCSSAMLYKLLNLPTDRGFERSLPDFEKTFFSAPFVLFLMRWHDLGNCVIVLDIQVVKIICICKSDSATFFRFVLCTL